MPDYILDNAEALRSLAAHWDITLIQWMGSSSIAEEHRDAFFYNRRATGPRSWRVGDQFLNQAPKAGFYVGWIYTTAGSPGDWRPFGLIA